MPKRNAVTMSRSFHCFAGDFFDAGRFKCPMIEIVAIQLEFGSYWVRFAFLGVERTVE